MCIDAAGVAENLAFGTCISLMRGAMTALSEGDTVQIPRQALRLDRGNMLGLMPGALGSRAQFGVKVVSVYPGNSVRGLPAHQGAVLLFEPESGALVGVVDASEITRIRTASASAAATDALAREDAHRLAVLGYGEQAMAHIEAIATVRTLELVRVWGRDQTRAAAFAERVRQHGIACDAIRTPAAAVEDADIICTTTGSPEPILFGADVPAGAHINIVGSSFAGPVEVDVELVCRSRFIADHREHVLAQGAEFIRARDSGRIDEHHIVAEIGEVFAGKAVGREHRQQITAYKSLGHVVQDLASAWHVYQAVKSSRG